MGILCHRKKKKDLSLSIVIYSYYGRTFLSIMLYVNDKINSWFRSTLLFLIIPRFKGLSLQVQK